MGDGWFGGMVPVLKTEETIDEYLFAIKKNLLSKEDTIEHLREQLKVAKDEAYASQEMQKMKNELLEMKNAYHRGFPISEAELEAIAEWQKNHDATEHNNPKGYHGCSGGGYVYEFYPTAIGTAGSCICAACRNNAHRWAVIADDTGGYNSKAYRDYMKEHNGEFEFQELG